MKIIAQIKLQPTSEQAGALKRTLETANAACNDISRVAWGQQVFGKYALQQLVYQRIKADYGLSAQMVIRCLAKVGDSYKQERKTQRTYKPHGSITYDDRLLSFNLAARLCPFGRLLMTIAKRFRLCAATGNARCCNRYKVKVIWYFVKGGSTSW